MSHLPQTKTNLFTGTFDEGKEASLLLSELPSCVIFHKAGQVLELYNVDTGFIAAHHGPFDNSVLGAGIHTTLYWDYAAFPTLNATFSGRYRCRTDAGHSPQKFQMHIKGKVIIIMYCIHCFGSLFTTSIS